MVRRIDVVPIWDLNEKIHFYYDLLLPRICGIRRIRLCTARKAVPARQFFVRHVRRWRHGMANE
jgi:hypothetical protein